MAYADEVLADSPYLYWKLDETSGSSAADSSGNGKTGTYIGDQVLGRTSLLFGDSGKCILNDHTANTGRVAHTPVAGFPTTEITVELWFKTAIADRMPVSVKTGSNINDLQIYFPTSTQIRFVVARGISASTEMGVTLTDNFRHHLVITWKSSDGVVHFYVDGTERATSSAALGSSIASGGTLWLGNNQNPEGTIDTLRPFEGFLDEFAIYPTAISSTRVLAHYNAGAPTASNYREVVTLDIPDLHWQLGESSGTSAEDIGSGDDGTYAGDFTLGDTALIDDSNAAVILNNGDGATGVGRIEIGSYNLPSPLTVEMWVKGSALKALFSYATGTGDAAKELMLRVVGTSIELHRGASSVSWKGIDLNDSASHQVVVTWSHSTGLAELFVDNVSRGPKKLSGSAIAGGGTFAVGVEQTDDGVYDSSGVSSVGTFDEVAVFSGILAAA